MKKFVSIMLCVLTIISMVSMFATLGFAGNAGDKGNTLRVYMSLKSLSQNTELATLKKCFPDINYSSIKVDKSSEIAKMDAWVMTDDDESMSGKHRVYPNAEEYYIYYYSSQTFTTNSDVVFWGEQANIGEKFISCSLYSY